MSGRATGRNSSGAPGSSGGDQRGRGRTDQRPRQHSNVSATEIPILRYGPATNIIIVRKRLSMKALQVHGDLGRLIETQSYFEPDPIAVDDYDLEADPHGINLMMLKDAHKSRMKRVAAMA